MLMLLIIYLSHLRLLQRLTASMNLWWAKESQSWPDPG